MLSAALLCDLRYTTHMHIRLVHNPHASTIIIDNELIPIVCLGNRQAIY